MQTYTLLADSVCACVLVMHCIDMCCSLQRDTVITSRLYMAFSGGTTDKVKIGTFWKFELVAS
jgi:hypothetical protein